MVYGIVRNGVEIKVAGSTVWLHLADASSHLKRLQAIRPQHWSNFKVVQIDASLSDLAPHDMYPYNPKMRSLPTEMPVQSVPTEDLQAVGERPPDADWRGRYYGAL